MKAWLGNLGKLLLCIFICELAGIDILVLLVLVLIMIFAFYRLSKPAEYLFCLISIV